MNYLDMITERTSRLMSSLDKHLANFAPKTELNSRTYRALTEARLWALVERHGVDLVREWIIKEEESAR